MKYKINKRQIIVFIIIIIFTIFLYQFNQIDKVQLYHQNGKSFESGEVVDIIQDNITDNGNQIGKQIVTIKLLSGPYKGKIVEANSSSSYLYGTHCQIGMRVIVDISESQNSLYVNVYSFDRSHIIYAIVVFFLMSLWIVGGKQGFNSAIALIFTFICIIFLFLPMIYKGVSPILSAMIISILITIVAMYLIGGWSSKTMTAIIGTISGVIISGIFAFIFSWLTHISGYNVSDIEQLVYLEQMTSIHIGELMYAGILISTLGAIMDVAMSISSTLNEIYYHNPYLSVKELFRSGQNVGKDMMGTMSNTLILAFTGSSINTLIFIYAYDYPLLQIMNMYSIGIEIIQGIAATLGVILTVPLVSLISAYHLKHKAINPIDTF